MRAFVYARYSSRGQQEISIEGQVRECTEYANKNDIAIVGTYADRARSGRSDEHRADFRRLMRDIETNAADVVLVWKMDRFFRNRAESALYRMRLEQNRVRLISVTEYIPDGSAGIITQGMIETVAEYFSAKLSEDVSRGMYDTAMQCKVTGSLPLGYRGGEADKKIHIDPVGAETVHQIFEMYNVGVKLDTMVKKLNDSGKRTAYGKPFTTSSFSKILRNEKYIGIYTYSGSVRIEGGCPRIIEDDLFFSVQRRLDANKHRPGAFKSDFEYYLSGKLFCGLCGSPMAGIHGTSRNGEKHYYYSCGNHRLHNGCTKKNVRKEGIEDAVFRAAISMLTDDMIAYISQQVEANCAEASESATLLASLDAQLRDIQRKIKNIGDAIAAGIITETTKEMLQTAEADRASVYHQIELAKAQAALVVKADAVACWLDQFRVGDKNDPDFKRRVFGSLVHAVYVFDDNLKIIFNIDKNAAVVVPFSAVSGIGIDTSPMAKRCSHLAEVGPP